MTTDVDRAGPAIRNSAAPVHELLHDCRPGLVLLAAGVLGSRSSAEDVVHDVFEAVLRRGLPFDLRRDPRAYLRTAVVNRCRSLHRRAVVRRRWEQRQTLDDLVLASGTDHVLRHAEVIAALRRLSRRQREVVVLRYWLDLPYAEIAEILGVPLGTVRSIAARSTKALAIILEVSADE